MLYTKKIDTKKIAIIGLVFLMLLSLIPTRVLSYELDEEKIIIHPSWHEPSHLLVPKLDEEKIVIHRGDVLKCYCDRIDGGCVIGFFVVFNWKNKASLMMIFRKFTPPGYLTLGMICTNISINVIDHNGTVFYHIELKEDDCLFVNNWFKVQNLQKPSYGKFYVVEIKIFGNYG